MSRIILTLSPDCPEPDATTLAIGLDHAFGYFLQVFGPDTPDGNETLYVDVQTDGPRSIFNIVSRGDLLDLLHEWAAPGPDRDRIAHQLAGDLPLTLA